MTVTPLYDSTGVLTAPSQPIRVGMIGYGYWGPKLARNFNDLENSQLAMVSDLRPTRLTEVQDLYPDVSVDSDYRQMLNGDVDAVAIATPVHTHFRLAQEALQAGKHVLVEKPITNSSAEARELIRLADEGGLTLMVGHTFEYNPAVVKVRQIVQSGELGKIYYLDATRVNLGLLQPDIDVFWDLAPHDLSIIRYVLGKVPRRVSASGSCFVNKNSNLVEVGYGVLKFEDDVIANMRLSWLDPVKQRRLIIVGSKKMLVYDDIAENKIVVFDKGVEVPDYSITEAEFHASYRHGEERVVPLDWEEPLRKECQHFIECIQQRVTPRSSGEVGLTILNILESLERSLRNGGIDLEVEY